MEWFALAIFAILPIIFVMVASARVRRIAGVVALICGLIAATRPGHGHDPFMAGGAIAALFLALVVLVAEIALLAIRLIRRWTRPAAPETD